MALAVTEGQLQELLDRTPFARPFGFRVHAIGDGECTLLVPFQKSFERPGGIVSGQVFMTAADVAFWLAMMTRLGMDESTVTVEMKTNFLAAARQEDFVCRARVLKLGKRVVFGSAECAGLGGALLAHHTLTYMRAG
jgi:uncharacterized protein (TIGR00369 family)